MPSTWERLPITGPSADDVLRGLHVAWRTWGKALLASTSDEAEARSLLLAIYHAGRRDAAPSNAEADAQIEARRRFLEGFL